MQYENNLKKLSEKQIFTVDHLSTWDETRLAINYYVYSHGVKCVVVDYLQNIAAPKIPSEYDRLNMIVRDLQKMAVKNDVFVCAFSQMNRESVRDDEEYVFGFKGSGNLENAADIAMIFKAASADREDPRRKLIIGKNRTGETGTVYFYTNFSYGYIKEVEEKTWKNYTKPSSS
jgi:replicative DNA helicase